MTLAHCHLPSAAYLLLAHPSWNKNREDYEQVLACLSDPLWGFDPNESHLGISMGQALLRGWSREHTTEETLIPIVLKLLERGADPKIILNEEMFVGAIGWDGLGGVRNILMASCNPDLSQRDREITGELMRGLTTQRSIESVISSTEKIVQSYDGWNTKINHIGVLPWIAMYSRAYGEGFPCWGGLFYYCNATDMSARVNLLRRLVAVVGNRKSGQTVEMTDVERMMIAVGIAGCASACAPHSKVGKDTIERSLQVIQTLMKGIDTAQCIVQVGKSLGSVELRARFGLLLLSGMSCFVKNGQQAWDNFEAAAPLLLLRKTPLIGRDAAYYFISTFGAPSKDFWRRWPATAEHHNLIFHFLLASEYDIDKRREDTNDGIRAALVDMTRWSSEHHDLPVVDFGAAEKMVLTKHSWGEVPSLMTALEAFCIQSAAKQSIVLRRNQPANRPRL